MSGDKPSFTVNPDTCPECAEARNKRVLLAAGTCPECGYSV